MKKQNKIKRKEGKKEGIERKKEERKKSAHVLIYFLN